MNSVELPNFLFIVVLSLVEFDPVDFDAIDEPVLLCNAPTPAAGQLKFERLGLADAH